MVEDGWMNVCDAQAGFWCRTYIFPPCCNTANTFPVFSGCILMKRRRTENDYVGSLLHSPVHMKRMLIIILELPGHIMVRHVLDLTPHSCLSVNIELQPGRVRNQ